MRRRTIRNTKRNIKNRNYTRRKRGAGIFDFFYKQRPSPEKTKEFIKTFKTYIEEIVDLQSAKKVLFKEKDKKKNTEDLLTKTRELTQYIRNIENDIDKNIKIDDIRENIVGGLPVYIIARTIEDKSVRTKLLKSLTEKGFNYNQTFLDKILENIDKKRKEEKDEEQRAKQEREKTIKEAKQKQTEEELANRMKEEEELENKRKMREEAQKILDEEERQRKATEAAQKKREEEEKKRQLNEEQDKISKAIEANKERIREEKERKEKEQAKNLEKNLKLLKKEKESSNKIRKIEPVKVVSSKQITSDYEEHQKKIREIQKAEEDNDNLKELLDDSQMNIVIEEASNKEPVEKVEKVEIEEKRIVKPTTIKKHELYDISKIPEYWRTYFPNKELYIFRDYMFSMLNDISLLYQITTDFFPSFRLDITNNKYINALKNDTRNIREQDILLYIRNYETLIRFVLLYIGIITNIMLKNNCYVMLKGGKAIQMNCSNPYESNDIDILIVSDEKNNKEIALEMGKLLIWILSQQLVIHNLSMIEIDKAEPIIKLSAFTVKGFEAVVDIGFNTPKEEIKSYVISELNRTTQVNLRFNYFVNQILYKRVYKLIYISQSVDGMIKEKLYYYLKYVILKNYTPEDNVEIFIPKIYKSLRVLLKCKYSNPTAHKKIILEMIESIVKEKEEYLKGVLEMKTINNIADEIIANIQ